MEVDKSHPEAGFVELEPLAVAAVDLVWVVVALACLIMVFAGWVVLYILHLALGKISVFGFHPFDFFYKLGTDALQAVAGLLVKQTEAFAHFMWALGQTVWRGMYVTGAVAAHLLAQISGVLYFSRQGQAQLGWQEQTDATNLRNQEIIDVTNLRTALDNAIRELQTVERQDFSRAEADISVALGGANSANDLQYQQVLSQLSQLQASLQGQLNTFGTAFDQRLGNVQTQLQGQLTNGLAGAAQTSAQDLATAEAFALGLVGSGAPASLTQEVAALQGQVSKIATDTAECLDPLCDTVTPQARRLGNLGRWFQNLEGLGVAAALVALAVEATHDPAAVVHDVEAVVHEVGDVVVAGVRDLVSL